MIDEMWLVRSSVLFERIGGRSAGHTVHKLGTRYSRIPKALRIPIGK